MRSTLSVNFLTCEMIVFSLTYLYFHIHTSVMFLFFVSLLACSCKAATSEPEHVAEIKEYDRDGLWPIWFIPYFARTTIILWLFYGTFVYFYDCLCMQNIYFVTNVRRNSRFRAVLIIRISVRNIPYSYVCCVIAIIYDVIGL